MPDTLIKTLQEEGREKFDITFGSPVGAGGLVEMTKGSDTMLISKAELLACIDSLISNAVERGRREVLEAAEGMMRNQSESDGYYSQALFDLLSKFRSDKE